MKLERLVTASTLKTRRFFLVLKISNASFSNSGATTTSVKTSFTLFPNIFNWALNGSKIWFIFEKIYDMKNRLVAIFSLIVGLITAQQQAYYQQEASYKMEIDVDAANYSYHGN